MMLYLGLVIFGIAVGVPFGCLLGTDGKGHSRIWADVNGSDK